MTFLKIVPDFLEGKKIRRKIWRKKEFIYFYENRGVLNEKNLYVNLNVVDYLVRNDNDWELFEETNEYTYTKEEVKALKLLYLLDGKFIARDENSDLYGYIVEDLLKGDSYWSHGQNYIGPIFCTSTIKIRKELFKNIKWEDENPLNIVEELKRIGELK